MSAAVAREATFCRSLNATEVEVPYLYDDGRRVHEATLHGVVYAVGRWGVDSMRIVLDDGDEVDVPRALRAQAEDDLRVTAYEMWRDR